MKTALIIFLCFSFAQFTAKPMVASKVRLLPSGVISLSEPIIVSSGESLIGNNTSLILKDGANCPMIIIGDTNPDPQFLTENVTISSIRLLGNKENQQWEGWGGDPIHKEHAIRNNGITVRHAKGVVINDVDISSCRSGGIVIERGSSDVVVINSTSSYNHFDGLAAYESDRVFCYNVNLTHNDFAGISLDLRFNHGAVVNSFIGYNRREGVFARHSNHNLFDRVTFNGNEGYHIFLAQSELFDSASKSNTFISCSFSNEGEVMKVNDSSCVDNFLIGSMYSEKNLISLLK